MFNPIFAIIVAIAIIVALSMVPFRAEKTASAPRCAAEIAATARMLPPVVSPPAQKAPATASPARLVMTAPASAVAPWGRLTAAAAATASAAPGAMPRFPPHAADRASP